MAPFSGIKKLLLFFLIVNSTFSFSQSFLNGSFENNTAGAVDQINLSNAGFNGFMANTNAFGSFGNMDIIKSATWGGGGAQHCTWYVALTGSGTDQIAMTLSSPLIAGNTYTISYYDRKDPGYPGFPVQMALSTTNNSAGTIIYTAPVAPTNNTWVQRTFTFVAPNNGQYIVVTQNGGNTGSWVHIDNFVMNNSSSTGGLNIAASATTICLGGSATFTVSGANSYTWNPAATLSSANASIVTATPPATTIYSVTGANGGCILTGSITLNVVLPTTIAVTPTLSTICSGSSTTLTATGGTTYTWTPATGLSTTSGSVVVASPTVNTTYTVVSGAGTCTSSAVAIVSVTPHPTITVTASPTLICVGGSSTLTATGATSYTWASAATLNSSTGSSVIANPNTTTTYTITGIVGTCTGSTVATLSVNPIPTVAITPTLSSICAGSSATLTANGGVTYTWGPATGLNTTTGSVVVGSPTVTTVYTVTSGAGTCTSSAVASISINPNPTITATASPSLICTGSNSTLTATGANSYTWSPAASLNVPTGSSVVATPNSTTIYTVTGSLGNCNSTTIVTLSVNTIPTVAVVGNFTVCAGNTSSMTASGAPSYSWSTGALTSTLNVTPPSTTVYTLTGINANCSSIQVVTVTVAQIPTVSVSGNTAVCLGQSTNLTANGATNYTWSTGATNSSIIVSPTIATSYTVIGGVASCTNSIIQSVSILPNPVVSVVGSNTICSGQSTQLSGSGASTYTWSTGTVASTITINPGVTNTFTVYGTAANGCTASASAQVYVQPIPSILLSAVQNSICYGSQTQLTAIGATNFNWSPSNSLSSSSGNVVTASPLSYQVYTVSGYIVAGTATCSSSSTIGLTVIPNATVNLFGKDSICYGQKVDLTAGGSTSYTWIPGDFLSNTTGANVVSSPTITTTYTVIGASTAGLCKGYNTITVFVNPLPVVNAGIDTIISYGDYGILNGIGTGTLYTWSGGDNSSINCINCPTTYINPVNTTCYLFEVTDIHGCKNTDEVCVTIDKDFGIYLPNSFTPNGDGLNEIFLPKGYGVMDYELYVFNRWGQKLYHGKGNFLKNEVVGWDGTFKGEYCKDDVYVYKIIYTNTAYKTQTKTGNVNLLQTGGNTK